MYSLAGINWIAVIVGVVVSNALGFLWYGPLFGAAWMKALGKRPQDVQASPTMYVATVISSLITMVVLAATVLAYGSAGIIQGAIIGAVLWIGFGATSGYVGALFEGKKMELYTLNTLYNLVIFVIMGAVFAAW